MEMYGNIRKMATSPGDVIRYRLPVGEVEIDLNPLIGHQFQLEYLGKIHCIRCGRETSKSFAQGYCYPCFISAPETEDCVLRPELCRAHEGIARDMEYARNHCLIEHVVYLSSTSGLKVGVTRHTQVPVRWIDQGAVQVVELARTPNRYTAGLIEVALKAHMSDKTNWRKMLTGKGSAEDDLYAEKERISGMVPEDLQQYLVSGIKLTELKYPVTRYPEKVKSLNLDKDRIISGILSGIKGQYLIFNDDRVINIRKFGGYLVRIQVD
jgi:hypothetical protein